MMLLKKLPFRLMKLKLIRKVKGWIRKHGNIKFMTGIKSSGFATVYRNNYQFNEKSIN